MKPELSIILVNYNEQEYLRGVLKLLQTEFSRQEAEIIVVDNASKDGSPEMVEKEFSFVKMIRAGGNLMYGKGNNIGFQAAQGDWLLVLNPDVTWTQGAIKEFLTRAKQLPNLGAAGLQVRYPDGRIQVSSHHRFPNWLTVFTDYCLPVQQAWFRTGSHPYLQSLAQHARTHQTATMTGVCLLTPRSVYDRIGGFDPGFTMYLEETEWQLRMEKAGLDRWFIADRSIVHFGSAQKSFAQASRHYLWGLEHYTRLHWRGPLRRARLLSAVWLGTILSLLFLILAWPLSLILGRAGRRVRHYLQQYGKLMRNLIDWPKASLEV